ncbi:MAG: 3,4-dehydroadipyl-CoA semialdehyde dehydrogenase [Planctomycetota bacterium]|nr:3,4-dehydroadipyl-CoA semialdehyde dehydrogenase [Planctomycetota bacterium]
MTTYLDSYVCGAWHRGTGEPNSLYNATTEAVMAEVNSDGLDYGAALEYARTVGGPALRAMSFAERGEMLKRLSGAIHEHRDELLDLSIANAGTTRKDAKFDIDGGTGTLAAYAYFGKDAGARGFLADGDGVQLGRTARFWGRHVMVPLHGAAVHINAFNFPAWNMLEKAACALLAGVPVIEKPGRATALVAWRIAQIIVESGILPEGAFQFFSGRVGDLLDRMGPQDSLAFTGSAYTGLKLRSNPNLLKHSVRVNIEADSLNAAVLGPGEDEGSETRRLFLRNVVLDMQQKTGQKCTAVRRILVPEADLEDVRAELVAMLEGIKTGDPADSATTMGPLASAAQLQDVTAGIAKLAESGRIVTGSAERFLDTGYFVSPTLIETDSADAAIYHEEEVFGPVATLMPYDGTPEAAGAIVARGQGCLVSSAYSNDPAWAERVALELAPWNGRLWIGSDKMAEQSLPPGMVLPAMIHGGPGRAGGGEELGGLRGCGFYMQRCAIQGFKGTLEASFGPPREAAATR